MSKTIFEKILDKEIPAELVHEDDFTVAFKDVAPQAPVHVLVIPRKKLVNVASSSPGAIETLGHVLNAARIVAEKMGIAESGYRLVLNNNRDGGQSVDYLHCHVIGGRALAWPPG